MKVAVVDATGKIYPHEPQRRWDEALAIVAKLARDRRVELIAIGNGTASRETEKLATGATAAGAASKIVVPEAGASVYSAPPSRRRNCPTST